MENTITGKTPASVTKRELFGTIFNIQRFSIHDGPGIRTLVFMKGCPLRCCWCSNPEGLASEINVRSNSKLCIGCGSCVRICRSEAIFKQQDGSYQIDRGKCNRCLSCAKICPANSKTVSGEVKTVAEVLEIVEKDQAFYKHSGGGITVGGGEMLSQPEFTYELLGACREKGLNTAVETSGFGSLFWLLKIAERCGTIHYDIKAFESSLHKSLTGLDNDLILDNLKALSEVLGKMKVKRPELIIRLPLVAGYNTNSQNIKAIAGFIKNQLSYYTLVEVLAFHNFGETKYRELGMDYELANYPNTNAKDLEQPIRILEQAGLRLKVPKW